MDILGATPGCRLQPPRCGRVPKMGHRAPCEGYGPAARSTSREGAMNQMDRHRKRPGFGALALTAAVLLLAAASPALAHGVAGKDAAFVAASTGAQILPFIYLG